MAADPIDVAVVCPVTVLGSINLNSLFELPAAEKVPSTDSATSSITSSFSNVVSDDEPLVAPSPVLT